MKPITKVFSIVPDCHTACGHYGPLWRRHFYDGIQNAVDQLITPIDMDFSWARRSFAADDREMQRERGRCSEQLWTQIQSADGRYGLNAVISCCFARDLDLEVIGRTIKSGIPWVNFFCDSTHRFTEIADLARLVSLNWFPEHRAIPRYRALGARIACLPYALNPDWLPELNSRSCRYPMGFIGLPSTNRITQLGLLRLMGCRVEVRGHGWVGPAADPFYSPTPKARRFFSALRRGGLVEKVARRLVWPLVRNQAKGPLSDGEFNEFVRDCQIILGLNDGRDERGRAASYLKFRDLEFPGYGCCYLTQYNEDVESAFELGREILTYRSIREAAAQARSLARDVERRRQIGSAGRRRVLASHTWQTRLQQLAERL